jgi:hypothetical protein
MAACGAGVSFREVGFPSKCDVHRCEPQWLVSGGESARVDGACWFVSLSASAESGNESRRVKNRA